MMPPPSSATLTAELDSLAGLPERQYRRIRIAPAFVCRVARAVDVLLLIAVGLVSQAIMPSQQILVSGGDDLLLALIAAWVGVTTLHQLDAYRISSLYEPISGLRAAATAVLVGALCVAGSAFLQQRGEPTVVYLAAAWALMAICMLAAARIVAGVVVKRWCAEGRLAQRVAVVGATAESCALQARLSAARRPAIDIVGVYDAWQSDSHEVGEGDAWSRSLRQLERDSRHADLDAVVIALPDPDTAQIDAVRAAVDGLAVDIFIAGVPYLDECHDLVRLGNVPACLLPSRRLSRWQILQKDIFDRSAAVVLLVLFLPFLIAIGIAVRLESPGPALFRQVRTGRNNAPFVCLKFRTMYRDSETTPFVQQAVRGDRRVTRSGALLRRTSLDELPQLLNVLRGDMSLVGPRPHAPNTCVAGRLFNELVANYDSRHRMKPGMTGWAQVNGWRGETPDVTSLERRVQHDLYYIQNWSMLLDMKILLRTALVVLRDSKAY